MNQDAFIALGIELQECASCAYYADAETIELCDAHRDRADELSVQRAFTAGDVQLVMRDGVPRVTFAPGVGWALHYHFDGELNSVPIKAVVRDAGPVDALDEREAIALAQRYLIGLLVRQMKVL